MAGVRSEVTHRVGIISHPAITKSIASILGQTAQHVFDPTIASAAPLSFGQAGEELAKGAKAAPASAGTLFSSLEPSDNVRELRALSGKLDEFEQVQKSA